MLLKQFYLNCLAHASYLVADERTGVAAVVDPQRDIGQYLALAEAQGLRIEHVILTHLHADFIAGHLELRDRTGASIYLGAAAQAEYVFTPLRDGDLIELGRVRLAALETPGHTAESISLAVYDLDRSATSPYAVMTGDTLFVGDVGRPDLFGSVGASATELAGHLYDSLRLKLLALPDESFVYPAHGAGSLCGKALGKETFSTIGEQRRSNYALQPMTKEAFVELVTADQPDAPAYFGFDVLLNSREHPTLDATLERELKPLAIEDVLALRATGAYVLDTRDPSDFAAAHLDGSINVGLGGQFATWVGTVLGRGHQIVLITEAGHQGEAAMRLGRIGFDDVVGYLADGLYGAVAHGHLITTTERLSPQLAADRLASGSPLAVDVRTPTERQKTRIPGSVGVPLNHLTERFLDLPTDRPLVVYLRRRLQVVDRREPPPASRICSCVGDCRRHHSLGNSTPARRIDRGSRVTQLTIRNVQFGIRPTRIPNSQR